LSEDEIAEILVFRQEQSSLALRTNHDLRVSRTRRHIGHVNNVMSILSQKRDQIHIHTFVDQPAHFDLTIDESFIGQIVSGKGLRRTNVIKRESGMIPNDCFRRHAASELTKYDLDRHTRAPDHGLASHNLWIDLDPIVCRHG
jgi:hypothetical protein